MKTWLHKAYLGVAWLIVAGIVIQFLLVGQALFVGGGFGLHIEFGFYYMGLTALALPILAGAAGLPRRAIGLSALLFVLMLVQMFLPGFRAIVPVVAALHPVNALLVLWLSLKLARQARAYSVDSARMTPSAAAPAKDAA